MAKGERIFSDYFDLENKRELRPAKSVPQLLLDISSHPLISQTEFGPQFFTPVGKNKQTESTHVMQCWLDAGLTETNVQLYTPMEILSEDNGDDYTVMVAIPGDWFPKINYINHRNFWAISGGLENFFPNAINELNRQGAGLSLNLDHDQTGTDTDISLTFAKSNEKLTFFFIFGFNFQPVDNLYNIIDANSKPIVDYIDRKDNTSFREHIDMLGKILPWMPTVLNMYANSDEFTKAIS